MIDCNIHFHSEMEDFSLEKEENYHNWLLQVINKEAKEVSILNYIFCSDEYLLNLNKKYLDHDYYTDILSFPLKDDPIEGDIFISVDRVKDNAKKFDIPFQQELRRVIIHGLLHFMGYDDHQEEDIKLMRDKENFYINLFS